MINIARKSISSTNHNIGMIMNSPTVMTDIARKIIYSRSFRNELAEETTAWLPVAGIQGLRELIPITADGIAIFIAGKTAAADRKTTAKIARTSIVDDRETTVHRKITSTVR